MSLINIMVYKMWNKQDDSLNMEDHIWIEKDKKMYLKRETGEVKIE